MFHPQDFPPEPFCKYEWLTFMEIAGMKREVTTELFVQFAKSLEDEGRNGLTENAVLKSEVLIQHLFNREKVLDEGLLPQIADIKFVVPHIVPEFHQTIHKPCSSEKFVCFSNAALPQHQELVWTTCDMISFISLPFNYGFRKPKDGKRLIEQLGLLQVPPLEVVLQHIQNVCDSLKEQYQEEPDKFDPSEVLTLMTCFYDHLKANGMKDKITKERLQQKPVLFLQEERKFVTCDRVVIRLHEEHTLKPYLYPAPEEYGSYFKLFELLGTSRAVTSDNYARVLYYLNIDVGDDELEPNELEIARKAIYNMFNLLPLSLDDTENQITVDVLYLPNRQRELVDSTQLIYSDKRYLEKHLAADDKADLFAGFPQLNIPFPTGGSYIQKLPQQYRPKILSDIVKQDFDAPSVEVMMDSEKTHQLCNLLHSIEFVEGLIRLIADYREKEQAGALDDLSGSEKETLMSSLQSINISEVTDLKVSLVFKDKVVGHENVDAIYEHKVLDGAPQWDFYFCVGENDNWLQMIESELVEMINTCLDNTLGSNLKYLNKLLQCINNVEAITNVLDKCNIMEYNLTATDVECLFPPAGTVIHPKWHHMLNDSFSSFEVGEYVALLVFEEESDDNSDQTDPVYIYAQTKKVLPVESNLPKQIGDVMRKYELDVGESFLETFPALRIYKFHRGNSLSTSKELELAAVAPDVKTFDDEMLPDICDDIEQFLKSVWKLPEDEKRLIIKRLMRQWHPDKNIGNEKFATVVFDCIKKTVLKLETAAGDAGNSEEDTVDARNYQRHAWFQQVDVVVGRERSYREQHFQHPGEYNLRPEPVSNPANARRWYKQAGKDLAAAQRFITCAGDVDGYNWICYKCHQSAEKALKALWFDKNANSHLIRSHDLNAIASPLEPELQQMTASLGQLLGNHTSMRYPDMHRIPHTPSDIFTKEQAEVAIRIASDIYDYVSSVM